MSSALNESYMKAIPFIATKNDIISVNGVNSNLISLIINKTISPATAPMQDDSILESRLLERLFLYTSFNAKQPPSIATESIINA